MAVNADPATLPGALAAAIEAGRHGGLHTVLLFRPRVDPVRVLDQSRSCVIFQCLGEAPDDECCTARWARRHFRFGRPP